MFSFTTSTGLTGDVYFYCVSSYLLIIYFTSLCYSWCLSSTLLDYGLISLPIGCVLIEASWSETYISPLEFKNFGFLAIYSTNSKMSLYFLFKRAILLSLLIYLSNSCRESYKIFPITEKLAEGGNNMTF